MKQTPCSLLAKTEASSFPVALRDQGVHCLHNKDLGPFVWTAKADDILQKFIRANRRLNATVGGTKHYINTRRRNGSDSFRTCATSDVGEHLFAGDDVTGQRQALGRKSQREPDQL
jgi:hypothetical protein